MFHNKLTEKMPCWKCKKEGNCELQEDICNAIHQKIAVGIEALSFICLRMEE